MKTQHMLVSFPGQGTDFFMDCLVSGNSNFNYYREFFNPTCTLPKYRQKIKNVLGSEHYPQKIFFYNEDLLKDAYYNTWIFENFNITKEVFSFSKIPFFKKYFNLFSIYRNRKLTFPTTRSETILPIFDSFIKQDCSNCEVQNEIQNYLKTFSFNNIEKQALSHIFCWFLQFHEIQKNEIKVMQYYPLVSLEKDELYEYLSQNIPKELNSHALVDNIMLKRDKEIKTRKYDEYKKLDIENVCLNLIKFLEKLNTGLQDRYWSLLV